MSLPNSVYELSIGYAILQHPGATGPWRAGFDMAPGLIETCVRERIFCYANG